jgi:hypothetical protein
MLERWCQEEWELEAMGGGWDKIFYPIFVQCNFVFSLYEPQNNKNDYTRYG